MSVNGQTLSVSYFSDGANNTYSVPYYFFAFTDLIVQSVLNGVATNLVYGTAWQGIGTPDSYGAYPNGGQVVFNPGYVPPQGATVNIIRSTNRIQPTNFIDNDPLSPSVLNHSLDRLEVQIQELAASGFIGVLAAPPASGIAGQWYIVTPFVPGGAFAMVCTQTGIGPAAVWNPAGLISL